VRGEVADRLVRRQQRRVQLLDGCPGNGGEQIRGSICEPLDGQPLYGVAEVAPDHTDTPVGGGAEMVELGSCARALSGVCS
jgi:hypothetical protein